MKPRKDLLDIDSLTEGEIHSILNQAIPMKELFTKSVKKVPTLKGKSVLTLFYEPSTRTRSSFEVAANRLSADVTNFMVSDSSVVKGETVHDTIDTLQAMKVDYIIVRHKLSGMPNIIARHTKASVINAGDGAHSHPTQGLLDAFTIKEVFPEPAGKKVLIVGDILHSRVVRSTAGILGRLGVKVAFLGPGSLVPKAEFTGIHRFSSFNESFAWKPDVIYLLRVQKERQDAPFFPNEKEYHSFFGITEERLERVAGEGIYLMHPGPVNRGVEICDKAMIYERTLINTQVENGIACRMAVLYHLTPNTQF